MSSRAPESPPDRRKCGEDVNAELETLSHANSEVLQYFESWELFEDYQTLASQDKYTFRGRKSSGGVDFREFSREFVSYLGLNVVVDKMALAFLEENKAIESPVTFRKPDIRRDLQEDATDDEVSLKGIKLAIELVILTAVTDCQKVKDGAPKEVLEKRISTFIEQDDRYKTRLLKKRYPHLFPEDISTLSWSIPYEWNKKILQILR